jgi:phosphoribosylformimino-5-aminoimidazole carboxamide ribotide isomerase
VLIPSIDLMNGKIVQLIQGERQALEFTNFEEWIERFSGFPLVQLIDLDAAMARGNNRPLIELFAKRLPCQVGGGIRSLGRARAMLDAGSHRVILGSALIKNGSIAMDSARAFARTIGPEKLVFAIDARRGKVAIRGWKELSEITPLEMIEVLDPCCTAYLYTNIDTEGLMRGLPLEPVLKLRKATSRQLIVAGGVSTQAEVENLHNLGIDAVVGMALYTGQLKLPDKISISQ